MFYYDENTYLYHYIKLIEYVKAHDFGCSKTWTRQDPDIQLVSAIFSEKRYHNDGFLSLKWKIVNVVVLQALSFCVNNATKHTIIFPHAF